VILALLNTRSHPHVCLFEGLEFFGYDVEGLVPRGFPEFPILADQGLFQPSRVMNEIIAESAFRAQTPVVGPTSSTPVTFTIL